MKATGAVVGAILIVLGIVAIIVPIVLHVNGTLPGYFLLTALLCVPGIVIIVIGAAVTRSGQKKAAHYQGSGEQQWRRSGH
jgi:peptidoglycan/LPS O-acetylase OafA/YrhL